MKILAIESSHDDTSVVLYENKVILKEISLSQTDFHKKFGGTVPEYSARIHFERFTPILEEFMKEFDLTTIDHVAYTYKPGLVGSLHMGKLFAHAIGFALNKEVRKINHMHGHIFAVCFNHEITFPALALIVSGGHTQLWDVKGYTEDKITLIGETKDDAVGEVYDKVARVLELGFPGGPVIDKLSRTTEDGIDFHINDDQSFNFSFSGLKTKVINYVHNADQKGTVIDKAKVAKGFQDAVVNNLISKTTNAINEYSPESIILGGGVSANSLLRSEFAKLHQKALIPEMKYTTDNAMMIAITSHLQKENE